MSKYRIERTSDLLLLKSLHRRCFPGEEWEDSDAYWVVRAPVQIPVGFCSIRLLKKEPHKAFLSLAGLLPRHRGNGLHRRLIQVRLRWAKKNNVNTVVTYATYNNYPSIVNLRKCGFRFFTPDWKWAGDVHYFWKDL